MLGQILCFIDALALDQCLLEHLCSLMNPFLYFFLFVLPFFLFVMSIFAPRPFLHFSISFSSLGSFHHHHHFIITSPSSSSNSTLSFSFSTGEASPVELSNLEKCLSDIIDSLKLQNAQLVKAVEDLVSELCRITLLWDEMWLAALMQRQGEVHR